MITIEAGVLAKAMKNAAAVVEGSNVIPILANVRLSARGDTVELMTSDLDIEFRQVLPLACAGELATTVGARRLAELASAVAPGSQLSLAIEGGRLTAKAGRSRWVLPVLPAEDFPIMPCDALGDAVTLPGKALAGGIGRCAWAMSKEPTRHYLCGLLFNDEGGRLRLTATEGNVLICAALDATFPKGAPDVIVPSKLVRTLERLAAEADSVSLAWDDRKLRAELGGVVLTGKLVEGVFPDYRRIIAGAEAEQGLSVILAPEAVSGALRRVRLVDDGKTRKIRFDRGEGVVTLSSAGDGEASEELPADCAAGHTTGFNAAYLADMVGAIGGDTIQIHQHDAGSPALVRRVVDDGAVGIVMPMRI